MMVFYLVKWYFLIAKNWVCKVADYSKIPGKVFEMRRCAHLCRTPGQVKPCPYRLPLLLNYGPVKPGKHFSARGFLFEENKSYLNFKKTSINKPYGLVLAGLDRPFL
jgi:hypothetical protein